MTGHLQNVMRMLLLPASRLTMRTDTLFAVSSGAPGEPIPVAGVASFFLEPLESAEVAKHGEPRRRRCHAGGHPLGGLALDVGS